LGDEMLWWLWSKKKILFIKDDVLQFESVGSRNPLSVLVIAWLWRMKADANTTQIVDF
jgi:hypothetical protein